MRKSIIYLLFLIVVASCTQQKQHERFCVKEGSFDETKVLNVSDSIEMEDMFDLLSWKISSNRICFVTGGLSNNFLSVYSYPVCEKLFDYGEIGQGPYEFITLNSGDAVAENMLLYDIMGRKLVELSFGDDSLRVLKSLPLYNDEKGLCEPFTFISQIKGDKYLMKVDEADSSYWDIADLGQSKILGSYKNPIRKKDSSYTPFDFIQYISDSTLVVAYKYIDRIEFYSIADDEIKPKFLLGKNKDQSDIKDYNYLMQYYLSVVARSGSILCLKSSDGTESGDIIEVYDINGESKMKYLLEKGVNSINIDAEGHIIGYVPNINKTILYRFMEKND